MRYSELKEHTKRSIGINLEQIDVSSIQIALNNPRKMYRSVSSSDEDILYIDPTQFTRKARNTFNYYTLLMDNLPEWSAYPKRSKAVVCRSDLLGSQTFVVLPIGNPKIGICPRSDLWYSFEYLRDKTRISAMDVFAEFIRSVYFDVFNEELDSDDYSIFISQLKKLEQVDLTHYKDNISGSFGTPYYSIVENGFNYHITIEKIADFLNPAKNGFKLTDMKNYNIGGSSLEVWFSGPAYLIRSTVYNHVLKQLGIK